MESDLSFWQIAIFTIFSSLSNLLFINMTISGYSGERREEVVEVLMIPLLKSSIAIFGFFFAIILYVKFPELMETKKELPIQIEAGRWGLSIALGIIVTLIVTAIVSSVIEILKGITNIPGD